MYLVALFTIISLLGTFTLAGDPISSIDGILNAKGSLFNDPIVPRNFGAQNIDDLFNYFQIIVEDEDVMKQAYANYKVLYKNQLSGKRMTNDDGRLSIFKNTIIEIFEHNMNAKAGLSSFEMGVNEFSDMTFEEIESGYMGYHSNDGDDNSTNAIESIPTSIPKFSRAVPAALDWRSRGVVSPVKNQGGCGSCVPFAATACLESAHAIWHNRQIHDLSEQELVDCSRGNGNNGCSGGTFVPTFNYLRDRGQGSEAQYRYEGRDGSCRSAGKPKLARVTVWASVRPSRDENALRDAVGNFGPVAIAIHVNDAFSRYRSGIFEAPCSGGRNHAVLAVGYGREGNKDFWIVKNSWGTGWGESGYIRLRRNYGNICDVAGDAVLVNA